MAVSGWSSGTVEMRAAAPITALPLTFSAWVYLNSVPARPFELGQSSANNNYVRVAFNASSQLVGTFVYSGTTKQLTSTATITLSAWTHIAATFTTDYIAVWISNTKRINTTPLAGSSPSNIDRLGIGNNAVSTAGGHVDGRMAEWGLWSSVLSDDEVTLLYRGLTPDQVGPATRVAYYPLKAGATVGVDWDHRLTTTVTGSFTDQTHPADIKPSRGKAVIA